MASIRVRARVRVVTTVTFTVTIIVTLTVTLTVSILSIVLASSIMKNVEARLETSPLYSLSSQAHSKRQVLIHFACCRQAITSAGTGAMAAMDAERYLCQVGC